MWQTKYGKGKTTITFLNEIFLDFCSSNSDCESFHLKTSCKESIPAGARTCLGPIDCTRDCLPGHYCDSQNRCKARRTEKGELLQYDLYLFYLYCLYFSNLYFQLRLFQQETKNSLYGVFHNCRENLHQTKQESMQGGLCRWRILLRRQGLQKW